MASIEKRGNNSYRIIVSNGVDGSGKRVTKKLKVTLSDKLTENQKEKEIQRQAALFEAKVLKGEVIDSNIKLKDFSEIWVQNYAEVNLQYNTLVGYKRELENRIIPALGHKSLDKIKPLDLISFYNNLTEDGMRLDGRSGKLSDRTIKEQHQILSSMFSSAVKWGLINSNPCTNVTPPKQNISAPKKRIKCFNINQANIFIEVIGKEKLKYQAAIYLALFGGLRRGEILALTWDDVDFDTMDIDINKARQSVHGIEDKIKSTKNESSNRKVTVPGKIIDILKQLKEQQQIQIEKLENLWYKSNSILTTYDGHPMNDTAPYQAMKKAVIRHNEEVRNNNDLTDNEKELQTLPLLTFHSLRHTSATVLINEGLNVSATSNRLGHSSSSTTLGIYVHALKSADQQASDMLDNIFKLPGESKLKLVK